MDVVHVEVLVFPERFQPNAFVDVNFLLVDRIELREVNLVLGQLNADYIVVEDALGEDEEPFIEVSDAIGTSVVKRRRIETPFLREKTPRMSQRQAASRYSLNSLTRSSLDAKVSTLAGCKDSSHR